MKRPCHAAHGPSPATCGICRKIATRPEYAARWGGAAGNPAPRPCRHLGPDTGEPAPCDCPNKPRVHRCGVHSLCTVDRPALRGGRPVVPWCEDCRRHGRGYDPLPSPPARWEWVSTADLARDAALLAAQLPPDCSGVVGLPRSGLIPAAVVATHLHLPLYELTHEGRLNRLGHGSRGRGLGFAGWAGPLAVIDDTVYSGAAVARARGHLRGRRAVFGAVYVRPEARAFVDLLARELPCPHLLEWNLFNNGPVVGRAAPDAARHWRAGVMTDLDGVLCHDAESGGPAGAPYLLPRRLAVPIVTGRIEHYRAETEAWLRRWGVKWQRLEMLPDAAPIEIESFVAHKARHYARSGCGLFVESDPAQAEAIHRATGRPVACPRAGRVWQADADNGSP